VYLVGADWPTEALEVKVADRGSLDGQPRIRDCNSSLIGEDQDKIRFLRTEPDCG
jgi:hypothetical protein